jgi:PDZ domain-containing secreted protein
MGSSPQKFLNASGAGATVFFVAISKHLNCRSSASAKKNEV